MRFDSTMKWYGGAALATVLVLLAGYFLLVSPTRSSADEITVAAQAQEDANGVTQQRIEALKAQYKNLPELQKDLAALQTHLPTTPQMPALLRSLSAAASRSGVTLVSVTPSNPTVLAGGAAAGGPVTAGAASAPGSVSDYPVAISIQGNFANVKLFMASLEAMPRSVLVTSLNVARANESQGATDAKSTANGSLVAMVGAHVFSATPGSAAAPVQTTTTTTAAGATGEAS
jgi:Tfp pilus assembly protein PilO